MPEMAKKSQDENSLGSEQDALEDSHIQHDTAGFEDIPTSHPIFSKIHELWDLEACDICVVAFCVQAIRIFAMRTWLSTPANVSILNTNIFEDLFLRGISNLS